MLATNAMMLAVLLSGPAPSPAPPAVAPHSQALCTTLRENVRTALAGLMKNDTVIEAGRSAFAKMALEQSMGSSGAAMERLYVENAVGALGRNLDEIDRLLADPVRFPAGDASEDARAAGAMKAELAAIEDAQKKALNLFSGVLESSPPGPAQPGLAGDAGSMELPVTPDQLDTRTRANTTFAGTSLYGHVADDIAANERETQALESKAAVTVMAAAADCSGAKP